MSDEALLTRLAWDGAAPGYDAYFVPRFAPYVDHAVDALLARCGSLPEGSVVCPCVGTGRELALLAARLGPGRRLVGVDLSAGMLERARALLHGVPGVELRVGDASQLDETGAALVFSAFGLQQLADPRAALASWASCLSLGGWLSVLFWPSELESEGPFATVARLVRERLGTTRPPGWEADLGKDLPGCIPIVDEVVAFPMRHPDAAAFFDALIEGGPARVLKLRHGAGFVEALRAAFLAESPAGELIHAPRARHLLLRYAAGP